MNENNKKLVNGAHALGYEVSPLRRNVLQCLNSGYCGFGCPADRKQGMLVTTIPDALRDGMRLYAEAPVQKIVHEKGKIKEVVAQIHPLNNNVPSSIVVRVRPKAVVLSAGAINGPALLLKSGLNVNQRVGQGLFLHPVMV